MPVKKSFPYQHAVVIGGSIAGLLAARVLAEAFDKVTVVERDAFPEGPLPRKGVPQSGQVHVLLRRGAIELEALFPGFNRRLEDLGATRVDWMKDLTLVTRVGRPPRFDSDFVTYTTSRGLLEYLIRELTIRRENIEFLQRTEATGLLTGSGGQVNGITLRRRGDAESLQNQEKLDADLVVDASGRSSKSIDWLKNLGYAIPKEVIVDSNLGYATRAYRIPASFDRRWKVLMVRDRPPFGTRGGVVFPIENDAWMVNLGGALGDFPPTDDAGFLEFARGLIHPELFEAIKDAVALTPISGYRRTDNRLNRFERMAKWPEGLVVVGDALCAFNPVYGQGMTIAAIEAGAIKAWLKKPSSCFALQKQLAGLLRTPWLMATTEDLRVVKGVNARQGLLERFFQTYFDHVQWLAVQDSQVFEAFMNVTHLVTQPVTLFQPRIAFKVLRHLLSRSQRVLTADKNVSPG